MFPGIPIPGAIAYLAAVDWLLDRCVTTTNVIGDSFVVMIMDHVAGGSTLAAATRRKSGTRVASFSETNLQLELGALEEAASGPAPEVLDV